MELPDWLIARVREQRPRPDGDPDLVVAGSTPVVCFGDQRSARVATLGINPSSREFRPPRLRTVQCVGAEDGDGLSDEQVRQVLGGCYDYFHYKPYWLWFGYFGDAKDREAAAAAGVNLPAPGPDGNVLDVARASYVDGTACHLDLVQWATSRAWSKVDEATQKRLLHEDAEFLVRQLTWNRPGLGRFRLVLVNGKTALQQCARVGVPWRRVDPQPLVGATLWTACWQDTPFVAWSTNLPYYATPPHLRAALPGHLDRLLSERGWHPYGDGQGGCEEEDRQGISRGTSRAHGTGDPALLALAENVGRLARALEARGVLFDVQDAPRRVEVRARADGPVGVVLHGDEVTFVLAPEQAQRLLQRCPADVVQRGPERWLLRLNDDELSDGQVHAVALIFALYALDAPPTVDDDRVFGLDNLVDAIVQDVAWRTGASDMRKYWAQRRSVLTKLLAAGLSQPPADPDRPWRDPEEDSRYLLELVQEGAEMLRTSVSPLSAYHEAPEVFLEVPNLEEHLRRVQELLDLRESGIRALMRDALTRAWPGIEQRAVSAAELMAHGVPLQPPRDALELAWDGDDADVP